MLEIKENIFCFQYMFFYIYSILSLVYLRMVIKNLPDDSQQQFLVKAMDYWKKKPIWKMKVLNVEETEEPKDMEKYSLGVWPGTVQGCNCSQSYNQRYLTGECSNFNLVSKCVNVKEQDPKNIYNYIFKYFVTYYDSDYLSLFSRVERNKNESKCKNGYKKCGSLDNMRNPFCVKEEEDCVMNYFFFKIEDDKSISLYSGFHPDIVDTNIAVINLFILDSVGCLLNEDYLTDVYALFKNKTNLPNCRLEVTRNLTINIPDSEVSKEYLYKVNNIYNGDGMIPGRGNYYNPINMRAMVYQGLHTLLSKYYYFDAYIFKHIKTFNIWTLILLKVGVQLVYFIFMQIKISQREKEIIYNSIWAGVLAVFVILIWMFNNSLFRSSIMALDFDDKLYRLMKVLRIIDVVLALIIFSAHLFKLFFIITNKGNRKKYSEFINQDK